MHTKIEWSYMSLGPFCSTVAGRWERTKLYVCVKYYFHATLNAVAAGFPEYAVAMYETPQDDLRSMETCTQSA